MCLVDLKEVGIGAAAGGQGWADKPCREFAMWGEIGNIIPNLLTNGDLEWGELVIGQVALGVVGWMGNVWFGGWGCGCGGAVGGGGGRVNGKFVPKH